jgi:hypothetical protein
VPSIPPLASAMRSAMTCFPSLAGHPADAKAGHGRVATVQTPIVPQIGLDHWDDGTGVSRRRPHPRRGNH